MFKDLKKFQAELNRYHDVNYASNVEIDCAKAKGDLVSYKIESQKSFNEYTRKINDLNQTILEMKKELFAHQKTISIMSQEKEARKKFHKTREDKELEKFIALENKIKVLDDIVYKTGQSVQTMNMINRNCKTSFVKPEFLKKAQRANPRLYDIGCYNDNLALMLAPESDEIIRLAQESRSKLKEILADLRYFNSLEHEVDSLKSQLETQKTQFLNEIDQLSREYYYADHMNATTCFQYNVKEFEALQQHVIDLELALQQCQEQKKNGKAFKENQSKVFLKEREQNFEIQDLKAQLHDKGIAISELKKLIEKMKGKSMETNLNAKTSNVNFICVTYGKGVLNDNRDMRVLHYLNGVNYRTKQPTVVPISTREPKRTVNQSAATPLKRTVAA
ncbi:hypothetical protein Tco_1124175 [Tanacetum coccineum]|uniref:Uncharacterized protein n=1 Tax=Tanacetum coccineum TaxID=301880 RepID=A0ABQ5J749_9ASTR